MNRDTLQAALNVIQNTMEDVNDPGIHFYYPEDPDDQEMWVSVDYLQAIKASGARWIQLRIDGFDINHPRVLVQKLIMDRIRHLTFLHFMETREEHRAIEAIVNINRLFERFFTF